MIAETLTLPSALDAVSALIDDKRVEQVKAVPLSNDTVARHMYV